MPARSDPAGGSPRDPTGSRAITQSNHRWHPVLLTEVCIQRQSDIQHEALALLLDLDTDTTDLLDHPGDGLHDGSGYGLRRPISCTRSATPLNLKTLVPVMKGSARTPWPSHRERYAYQEPPNGGARVQSAYTPEGLPGLPRPTTRTRFRSTERSRRPDSNRGPLHYE